MTDPWMTHALDAVLTRLAEPSDPEPPEPDLGRELVLELLGLYIEQARWHVEFHDQHAMPEFAAKARARLKAGEDTRERVAAGGVL